MLLRSAIFAVCIATAGLLPAAAAEPAVTQPALDIVAIGDALVDVIATCDDAFLVEHGLPKGLMQLLDAEIDWIDGVLITHEHADHTHGIDDLRPLFVQKRRRVNVYLDEPTSRAMHARFGYCFMSPPGSEYPPIATEKRLVPGKAVTVEGQGGGIEALPVLQHHGDIPSLGFRFGPVAYSADIKGLPDDSVAALADLDVWIVDALRRSPHPSHFNLEEALDWIERVKPKRAILTNLHTDMDYAALCAELPPGVEPGYDRMSFAAG